MKTADLTCQDLDYAVALASQINEELAWWPKSKGYYFPRSGIRYSPSTQWKRGGPFIDRVKIDLGYSKRDDDWMAGITVGTKRFEYTGDTPLVAAMRCYVASVLGSEINLSGAPHETCPTPA